MCVESFKSMVRCFIHTCVWFVLGYDRGQLCPGQDVNKSLSLSLLFYMFMQVVLSVILSYSRATPLL